MAILALDLGTKTGWALHERSGETPLHGTESFEESRHSGGGMRFLRFKRWLTEIKNSVDTDLEIYYEEVGGQMRSGQAGRVYGGFWATLTAWCEHHEIPYEGIPIGTVKKFATGKGNASKEDMIAYAKNVVHNFEGDDNAADAVCVLRCALHNINQQMGSR